MEDPKDKAAVGTDAVSSFVRQFGGDDIYSRIIAEEILKAILGVEDEE